MTGLLPTETVRTTGGHEITFLPIESSSGYLPYLPTGWQEYVDELISQSDLVIPAYFPPELETTAFSTPILGSLAVRYANQQLQVYETAAESAAAHDKQVAVMDPANNPWFSVHETNSFSTPVMMLSILRRKGVATRTPDIIEQIIPTATDARRMLTTEGIRQEAQRWPDGGKFLYIAAPAHTFRVQNSLTRRPSLPADFMNQLRYAYYQHAMPGIDRSVRTYQHDKEAGWQLVGRDPIT